MSEPIRLVRPETWSGAAGDWVSGEKPMPPAQALSFKKLWPELYQDGLTAAEAQRRIVALTQALVGKTRPFAAR